MGQWTIGENSDASTNTIVINDRGEGRQMTRTTNREREALGMEGQQTMATNDGENEQEAHKSTVEERRWHITHEVGSGNYYYYFLSFFRNRILV